MRKVLLALFVGFMCLPLGGHAQAAVQCPDGQVKWDAVADEFVYIFDDPNGYIILVDPQEDGWDLWTVETLGCGLCAVCISYGDELEWRLNTGPFGAAHDADHIVWWGQCQVPCEYPVEALPYRSFVPVIMGGGHGEVRISE